MAVRLRRASTNSWFACGTVGVLGGRIEVERLTGHLGPIDALAMTPDGKRVVSGSGDTTIRVWDSAAGTSEVSHGHHGRVSEVDVSSDGRRGPPPQATAAFASGTSPRAAKSRCWDSTGFRHRVCGSRRMAP